MTGISYSIMISTFIRLIPTHTGTNKHPLWNGIFVDPPVKRRGNAALIHKLEWKKHQARNEELKKNGSPVWQNSRFEEEKPAASV